MSKMLLNAIANSKEIEKASKKILCSKVLISYPSDCFLNTSNSSKSFVCMKLIVLLLFPNTHGEEEAQKAKYLS